LLKSTTGCYNIFTVKDRIYIKDLKEHVGKEVTIAGWVNVRRNQGKMVFFDMRDMTGRVQCVALPSHADMIEQTKEIRLEWVLKIRGLVNKRPDKNINAEMVNGDIELEILKIEILSEAAPLPFDMSLDGYNLELTAELDNRSLILRQQKVQAIFYNCYFQILSLPGSAPPEVPGILDCQR